MKKKSPSFLREHKYIGSTVAALACAALLAALLIRSGALTVMISHSSLNGVKMHENAGYIQRLKEETGFRGFVVSDWNAVQNIPGVSYRDRIVRAVNAGIDMLMEADDYNDAASVIVQAAESGEIPLSRVDDAVSRILYVKQKAGLFDDPYFRNGPAGEETVGGAENRALAEQLVEKSLVLLSDGNLAGWDGAVMCCLPGSEGAGVTRVLCGETPFTGRLPSPWYRSADGIGTEECRWPAGYGLQ